MGNGTTLLFDLPGFRVVECREDQHGHRHVVVMGVGEEHACPVCGVLAGKPYDVRESRVKELPFGERLLSVTWRKRRFVCAEARCPRRVFTETSAEIPPRRRLTSRLRRKLEAAASGSARSCADVAREYRVSNWSVHQALVAKAAGLLAEPPPVRRLGWMRPAPARCAGSSRKPDGGAATRG